MVLWIGCGGRDLGYVDDLFCSYHSQKMSEPLSGGESSIECSDDNINRLIATITRNQLAKLIQFSKKDFLIIFFSVLIPSSKCLFSIVLYNIDCVMG